MKSKDVLLSYEGFQPTDHIRGFIHRHIEELHGASPYGSLLNANFTHVNGAFEGVIRIQSAIGGFLATAWGQNISDVVKSLLTQINRQLEQWRVHRFQDDSFILRKVREEGSCFLKRTLTL